MTREEVVQILQNENKTFICDVIIRLIESKTIDITDFNTCYINVLQKRLSEKDKVIKEADVCIFNSLIYDKMKKTDSSNVVLDKVRWMYRNSDINKENLCEMFNYNAEKDTISLT